ncbi:topology modulation protein [Halobacillus kuroshimensis]|uniref:Topology modulation protein n=1 Tax=Halobacillus kuroshimensis TaxID=302481 RepID=A0ABS3E197_9BACI|nr:MULTISPECIES: topology modulation protein [Halobacillus]MBN8237371.1 topology modulation protein [Halobacillus kuroshimensis]
MKRVMILGVSSGVGKSTLAREMGKRLDLPVYHLDALHWEPGWKEADPDVFAARQKAVTAGDEWIIEGNYRPTYNIRAARADTIVYVELPLRVCLYRVLRRWWQFRGRSRPDLGAGCEERLDYGFLSFVVTTYRRRKKEMQERLLKFQLENPSREVIQLKNKREIHAFLDDVSR